MGLDQYFSDLIRRVENSEEIHNQGKDKDGFFKPTRTILLRHLNLLRDLHGKPRAQAMVKTSWDFVAGELPPEWLEEMSDGDRAELKRILGGR